VYPLCLGFYHADKGRRALDEQDYPLARSHWEQCVQAWPTSAEAHFCLARACRGDGDLVLAGRHLSRAEKLGWPSEATELERLLLRAQLGDVDAVAPPLQKHLDAGHIENHLILEALVLGFIQCNRLHEARLFAALLSNNFPDRWRAHLLLGRVHEQFLRPDLAAGEYRKVLERRPDHSDLRLWLARHLLGTGAAAEALPHFQTYQQARPDDPEARLGIAACQYELGQLPEARDSLEPLLKDPATRARALLLRGKIELDLNGAQAALPWFQQAETLTPGNPEVTNGLAAAWRQLGDADRARPYEERRHKLRQDLAQVEELTRKIGELDKNAEPAERDQRVHLRYQLGLVLLRVGDNQRALAWLRSALQEDPQHGPTHQALAEYYQRMGDPEQARSHQRFAEGASPPGPGRFP
jgi:tetratricopeptide (TPR) repeat protein